MEIMDKLCFVRHTNPVSVHKIKNNYERTRVGMSVSVFNHSVLTQVIYHTKSLGDGASQHTKVWL
jgi:hypothetical protein